MNVVLLALEICVFVANDEETRGKGVITNEKILLSVSF